MITTILETLEKQNIIAQYKKDVKNNIKNMVQDFSQNFYFYILHNDVTLSFRFIIPNRDNKAEFKDFYELDFRFDLEPLDDQEVELCGKVVELDSFTGQNPQIILLMYGQEIKENNGLLLSYSEQEIVHFKNQPIMLRKSIKDTTFNEYLQEVHKNHILPYLKKFNMEIDGQTFTLDKEHRKDIIKEYKEDFKSIAESFLTGKITKVDIDKKYLENALGLTHEYSIIKSHHQMSEKLPKNTSPKLNKAKI